MKATNDHLMNQPKVNNRRRRVALSAFLPFDLRADDFRAGLETMGRTLYPLGRVQGVKITVRVKLADIRRVTPAVLRAGERKVWMARRRSLTQNSFST